MLMMNNMLLLFVCMLLLIMMRAQRLVNWEEYDADTVTDTGAFDPITDNVWYDDDDDDRFEFGGAASAGYEQTDTSS